MIFDTTPGPLLAMSAPSAKSAHANSTKEGICVISEPKGATWFPDVEPTLMAPCRFGVKKFAIIMSTGLQLATTAPS